MFLWHQTSHYTLYHLVTFWDTRDVSNEPMRAAYLHLLTNKTSILFPIDQWEESLEECQFRLVPVTCNTDVTLHCVLSTSQVSQMLRDTPSQISRVMTRQKTLATRAMKIIRWNILGDELCDSKCNNALIRNDLVLMFSTLFSLPLPSTEWLMSGNINKQRT